MTTSPVTTYDRHPQRASHAGKVLLVLAVAIIVVLLLLAAVLSSGDGQLPQLERLRVAQVTSVGLELFLIIRLMRTRAVFTVGLFTLAVTGLALYLLGSFN